MDQRRLSRIEVFVLDEPEPIHYGMEGAEGCRYGILKLTCKGGCSWGACLISANTKNFDLIKWSSFLRAICHCRLEEALDKVRREGSDWEQVKLELVQGALQDLKAKLQGKSLAGHIQQGRLYSVAAGGAIPEVNGSTTSLQKLYPLPPSRNTVARNQTPPISSINPSLTFLYYRFKQISQSERIVFTMPDPLPPESTYSTKFAECVQKYTNEVYVLSSMLLEQSNEADKITIRTFTELHKIYRQDDFDPQLFSIHAYRTCIHQCADSFARRSLLSAKALPWEEQLVKVMWYGLKLPLSQISIILQKSVPALKAQLRAVREQMTTQTDILTSANLSII